MDPLKLLTRSTTLSKGSRKSDHDRILPSSGQSQNSRLFGCEQPSESSITNGHSKKRKRGQVSGRIDNGIPRELDFFGSKQGIDDGHEGADRVGKAETTKEATKPMGTFEVMTEEDRKKVLKTHRLRIVVLDDGHAQWKAKEVKPSKTRKAHTKRKELSKEKTRLQIYPQPLTDFSQLATTYGISRKLVDSIESQGFTVPTEVQLGSLPLLCGPIEPGSPGDFSLSEVVESSESPRPNLLTVAPTGSGKTLAFLIPLIHALQSQRPCQGWRPRSRLSEYMHWPQAVIVVPTRELALQIVTEGRVVLPPGKLRLTLMRKGMRIWPFRSSADTSPKLLVGKHGGIYEDDESDEDASKDFLSRDVEWENFTVQPEIIVTTPLTLLNSLHSESGIAGSLENVQYLVLDEADVLLDPLFREQTLAIWHACTAPALQVSLWSATMGSNIEQLAQSTVEERIKSLSDSSQAVPRPLIRLVVGLKDTALPTISQRLIYAATEQGKLLALRQMIHPTAPTTTTTTSRNRSDPSPNTTLPVLTPPLLIFTQTIPRAQSLHTELLYDIPVSAGGSTRIACLHASLPPKARAAILTRFRKGEVWILITTDLLARGMDFRGVNAVVNYDVPNSSAAYVHRVGRTGRAGREGGVAVTLYTKEDVGVVKGVANVIKASERMKGVGGEEGGDDGIPEWLMKALPSVSKNERKRLKRRGVEARREGLGNERGQKGRAKMRISTKSGFDRRMENNRRGAVEGSKRRQEEEGQDPDGELMETDFSGFDD
ncbi:MAG: hypothetical protein Q9165_006896 [Trypethelium subeluteriae]